MKLSEQARARELYVQGISRQVIATRLGASLPSGQLISLCQEKPCSVCNKQFHFKTPPFLSKGWG